ncbi:MAG: DUF4166 domain-containing protein [Robiginitomaculum sp.]|nr:DUF4166 domain-containing protein [Robiginitomaculum sp.]
MTHAIDRNANIPIDKPVLKDRAPDFEKLTGAKGWARLHPAIRKRFSDHNLRVTYPGTLKVQTSRFGFLFAVLLYPFGKPLPLARARSFVAEVKVFPDKRGGVVWQRNFLRPNQTPLRIESVKQLGADGGLMECIRPGLLGGIGMGLRVYEQDSALNFASTYYFLRWGRLRLPIPLWLTPGRTLVEHIDEGGKNFRFRLTMTHPLFGRTVYQDGLFSDLEKV